MPRSWRYGASVVAGAHILWFVLIYSGARVDWFMPAIVVMFFVTLNIAGLGSFINALLAEGRWLWHSISMAPLAAALATLSNLMLALSGTHLDFSGFRGNLGLFAVSLAYGAFVALVGAGIGRWMRRRPAEASPAEFPPPAPVAGDPDSVN